MEICQKIFDPHMAPFKIIQGHCNCRDRLATYDFLLVFHSNYGPISYLIEIKENIGKIFLPTHIKGEAFFICVSHATVPREWGISIPKFLGDTPPYALLMPLSFEYYQIRYVGVACF